LGLYALAGRSKSEGAAPERMEAAVTPNGRHERRAKGREAALGTSARWEGLGLTG